MGAEKLWWYKDISLVCPVCRKAQQVQERCYGEPEDYDKVEEEYCGCLDDDDALSY
jgi:hypothetical protein